MDAAAQKEPVMEREKLGETHLASLKEAVSLFRKKAVGEHIRNFEDELSVGFRLCN